MPTIVKEDHDKQNVSLTLTIPVSDYEPQYKAQLNKYRKEAHMKGFRKGKTPLSVVRKMYGQGALVDIINKIVGEEVDKYIKEADFDILGQPLPAEDQIQYDFDTKNLQDFVFKFDLGLSPEFEVQGLEETTFDRYDVTIPDEMVEGDLADAQKKLANQISVDDEVQEEDILKLQADELNESGLIKENGFANEFSLSYPEMTEEAKAAFNGKKKGDYVQFDIYKLSEGKDEAFVRKYFLDVNEDADESPVISNTFQALISDVTRAIPAELNEEFYEKYFGKDSGITDKEGALNKFKENTKVYYDRQADALLYAGIKDKLEELNPLTFPEEFLKRWVTSSGNLPEGKTADDEIDNMTKGLAWNLIRNKLAKRFDIKVEEAEIKQALRMQMVSYFGGQDLGSILDDYVNKMMENEQQYNGAFTQVLSDKLFNAMREVIKTNPVAITAEGLEEAIKAENAKYQPEPEAVVEETTSDEGIEEAEIIEE